MQLLRSFVLLLNVCLLRSFQFHKCSIKRYRLQAQIVSSPVTPHPQLDDLLRKKLLSGSKFVFIGGKGGVGKTTSSSAVALASSDHGLRTLVVSTDPAHSLGDALDVDLRSGEIVPVISENNLWALEIDIEKALLEFKSSIENFDSSSIAKSLGIPREIVDSFGIQDVADIFVNPPPGIDEIVALSKIFQYAEGSRFDRVVIDTAPTGHTLRLLQLPQFLNTLTGRLLKLRAKIYSAVETFQGFFGGGASSTSPGAKITSILDKLDTLQTSISTVQRTLKDPAQTQFVIVTIPTILAVAESKRLLSSLQSEGIAVSNIICNQVLSETSDLKYIQTRAKGQQKCIESINRFVQTRDLSNNLGGDSSGSGNLAATPSIEVTEVPFVDTEVTGVFGLRFFHSLAHPVKPRSATNPMDSRKLTIFGGKGGVGKTTSAASWAVRLGDSGFRTLLVSSDPAHSLGDALQLPLTGTPQAVDLLHHHNHHIQDTTSSGDYTGELWAMEIDPAAALEEFKNLVRNGSPTVSPNSVTSSAANPGNNGNGKGILSSLGLPDLGSEMSEMVFGIQEPPPGTDEIVALAKVIDYLDNGYTVNGRTVKFDRIVLDTAPTGHTLRMLQLPEFLQQTIAKLKAVRAKTSMSMGGMLGMFGGGSGGEGAGSAEELQDKTDALDRFRERMQRLETVLHSPKDCEFTAVTIPTELATSETQRLLDALQKNNIPVRRLIINQVLPSMEVSDVGSARDSSSDKGIKGEKGGAVPSTDKASAYLDKLRAGQQSSIAQLRTLAAGVNASLIEVPYFDTEVRTVYGLRLVSNVIVLVVMNTIK